MDGWMDGWIPKRRVGAHKQAHTYMLKNGNFLEQSRLTKGYSQRGLAIIRGYFEKTVTILREQTAKLAT